MEYQAIHAARRDDGIGVITLNRPEKRNAISIAMRREISRCLSAWEDDPEVGVVIFTGAGTAFSAGFDLDEFRTPELFDEILESSGLYHLDVWRFPKPTIAAVNGPALGGGFDLAALCDIRLCAESARFGHPELKFGAPPLFTPLRWIVGDGIARDLCLTGRRIDAREAYRIRFVSEVETDELLAERALQLGGTLLEAPAATLRYAKRIIASAPREFEEAFRVEHDQAFTEVLFPALLRGK